MKDSRHSYPWLRRAAVCAFLALPWSSLLAGPAVQVLYHEPLDPEVVSAALAGTGSSSAGTLIRFDAFGRRTEISLQVNARVSEAAGAAEYPALMGTVNDVTGSWARLTRSGAEIRGMYFDGAEVYVIEPALDAEPYLVTAVEPGHVNVIYRLAETLIDSSAMSCGMQFAGATVTGDELLTAMAQEMNGTPTGEPPTAQALGASRRITMGVVGDYEFYQANSGDAAGELVSRVNVIDGIFSSQAGLEITVADVVVFDTPQDPFTFSDSSNLLNELSSYRQVNQSQFGLTHLFTGRNLTGTTVGIAWMAEVCHARFGAALTQTFAQTPMLSALIAAHEIGHNFNAPHDAQSGSPCESTPGTFIMAPSVNGNAAFSACSLQEMAPLIATGSCIVDIGDADMRLGAIRAPDPAAIGSAFDIEQDLVNDGNTPAENVTLSFAAPLEIEILSGDVSGGSCSVVTAQQLSCDLGSVPGGALRTVTASVSGDQEGDFTIIADVTSLDDTDPTNNNGSQLVSLAALIDLEVSTNGSVSVIVDQRSNTTVTVSNNSAIGATMIEVTLSPGTGFTLSNVSSSQASCQPASGMSSCSLAALAGQSQFTIDLAIDGETVGNGTITIDATAAEMDANAANNSAALNVNVTATSATTANQSSGGGGGSVGWLFLLAALIRPRRTR